MSDPVVVWSWVFLVLFVGLFLAMGFIGMRRTNGADDFAVARSSYGPWATKTAAISSFLVGVGCYALIYLGFMPDNPFGSAGYSVIIASIVMLVVTPLTKPLSPEFVAEVFGDPSPSREPAPIYASTALEDPESESGATS